MSGPPPGPVLPEAARDRELRRRDWQFLRPGVVLHPLHALGGAALRAVGTGSPPAGIYFESRAPLPGARRLRARLESVRRRMLARYGVATSLQFGPRYLHSTGQIHKGGPNSGIFLQVVDAVDADLPIPGRSYSFGTLMRAQADGDLMALSQQGRRATRLSLAELEEATR